MDQQVLAYPSETRRLLSYCSGIWSQYLERLSRLQRPVLLPASQVKRFVYPLNYTIFQHHVNNLRRKRSGRTLGG